MTLLRLAIEIQRWDLAAHIIVLASARAIKNREETGPPSKLSLKFAPEAQKSINNSGDKPNAKKTTRRH